MGRRSTTGLACALCVGAACTSTGSNEHPVAQADAASGDAVAAVACSDPALLFCEDFESYSPGAATSSKWQSVTKSASDALTIETSPARGSQSLHVHTSQNEYAYIKLGSFGPPNNSFFGRLYVWIDALPTAPAFAHFTLVEAAGQPAAAGVVRPLGGQYDPQGMSDDWGVGSDQGPTGDWTNWRASSPAQTQKWLCVEWEMLAAGDVVNVWIDGAAQTELSVSMTMHGGTDAGFVFPTWQTIWFGYWLYQASPTPSQFDLWYDDIALSTTRIGC
jgi:hypothetical protein